MRRGPSCRTASISCSRGPADVHVDLGQVSFIDSSALGVLVDAFRQLHDRHGHLVVTTASPIVTRTLEISGLAPYLLAGAHPNGTAPPPEPDRPGWAPATPVPARI